MKLQRAEVAKSASVVEGAPKGQVPSSESHGKTVKKKADKCTLQTPLKPGIPGSPGNLIESSRNPNGDSELSALMRKMLADLHEIRQQLVNGEVPASFPTGHERIRCSWPTDLQSRNEIFDAMARQYLNAYKSLTRAKSGHAKRFDAVVNSCVTCHENSCRGPIPMIKALLVESPAP